MLGSRQLRGKIGHRQHGLRLERLEDRHLLSISPGLDANRDDLTADVPAYFSALSAPLSEAVPTPYSATFAAGVPLLSDTSKNPQSKVWTSQGAWWTVESSQLPTAMGGFAAGTSGTFVWQLSVDGAMWTPVLQLTSKSYKADILPVGDGSLTHVLLYRSNGDCRLASIEFSGGTYQMWQARPSLAVVNIGKGSDTATFDVDSTGRMWVVNDTVTTIEARYSDASSNYNVWSGPITLATSGNSSFEEISAVRALPNGTVGVLWSDHVNRRFGFRVHVDGAAPTDWLDPEIPAQQSILNPDVGHGIADDHINLAVASDGTLYAAVKTAYDAPALTEMALLVRRPPASPGSPGSWDPLYGIDYHGTRGIVVLNEVRDHLLYVYAGETGPEQDIVYKQISLSGLNPNDPLEYLTAPRETLLSGMNKHSVSSTRQNFTDAIVFVATVSTTSPMSMASVLLTADVTNRVPVAADDNYLVAEDGLLTVAAATGVLLNDSDADGDPLTAQLFVGPRHGSLALTNDGAFAYTPAPNYNGPDTFTYFASDGVFESALATVYITVTAVDDLPVANDDAYSMAEDGVLTVAAAAGVLINDSDGDGDALIAKLSAEPSHGTLSLSADGSFVYAPASNYNGPDSFTYIASDGVLGSALTTVYLTVTPVADAPLANKDVFSVAVEGFLTIATPGVLNNDSDGDGDALIAKLSTGPSHGTLAFATDGSFEYTPAPGYHGPDSFTYLACDGVLSSAPTTVLILVNTAPFASADSYNVTETGLLTVAAPGVLSNDTDGDGDGLTAVLASDVSHGLLTLNADGSFQYKAAAGYSGADAFAYWGTDGVSNSNLTTVNLTVTSSAITVSFQDGVFPDSSTFDTSIKSNDPTTNFGTKGELYVDGDPDQFSLIKWNLDAIPVGSQVTAVTLTFNVTGATENSYGIFPLLRNWSESQANWTLASSDTPWQLPGALGPQDRGPMVGTLGAPSEAVVSTVLNADGIAAVQGWVDAPQTNYGFAVQRYVAARDGMKMSSREARAGNRPMITVTYLPPSFAALASTVPEAGQPATTNDLAILSLAAQFESSTRLERPALPPPMVFGVRQSKPSEFSQPDSSSPLIPIAFERLNRSTPSEEEAPAITEIDAIDGYEFVRLLYGHVM